MNFNNNPNNQVPVAGAPVQTQVPVVGQQQFQPAGQVPVVGQPVMAGAPMGVPVSGFQPMSFPVTQQPSSVLFPTSQEIALFGSPPPKSGNPVTGLSAPGQATQLQIRRLVMIEAKPQNQQYARNYIPLIDNNTVRALENIRDTSPMVNNFGEKIPKMDLSSSVIASIQSQGHNIFGLSPTPSGQLSIENGWGTVRMKFTLTVDVFMNGQFILSEFINGYTDYNGVDFNKEYIDPNMVFYIDSITSSSPYPNQAAPNGVGFVINKSNLVIANNTGQGFNQPRQLVTTRPMDVFTELNATPARKAAEQLVRESFMGGPGSPSGSIPYMNLSTTVGSTPRLSKVDNNSVTQYTASILNTHATTFAMADDYTNVFSAARGLIHEDTLSGSHFITLLDNHLGGISSATANTFTMRDLYRIDPILQNPSDTRVAIFRPDQILREIYRNSMNQVISIPPGSSVDAISGTGAEFADVTALALAASTEFRKIGVSYITCILTNHGGFDEVKITSLFGLDDGTLAIKAKTACENIITQAVHSITKKQMSYNIVINMDVYNDSYFKYQMGMGHSREFVVPQFALAMLSPVMTFNQAHLDNITSAIHDVTSRIHGHSMTLGGITTSLGGSTY